MGKVNREHFGSSGESENENWVAGFEERTKQRIEKSEKSPELLEFLGKVNFESLREIFRDIAVRSGVDSDKINFIDSSRIADFTPSELDRKSGIFGIVENFIYLSLARTGRNALDIGVDADILGLHTLCHEEVHAVSRTVCVGVREFIEAGYSGTTAVESGFSRETVDKSNNSLKREISFKFFDEGVTEKLAREISSEYVSRNPDLADEKKIRKFQKTINSKDGGQPYDSSVLFLEKFIKRISLSVGVDEKTVWQAIVRGKLEGVDFDEPELRDSFLEFFPADFLDAISRVSEEGQMLNLINGLDIPSNSPSIEKFKRWFNRLGISKLKS